MTKTIFYNSDGGFYEADHSSDITIRLQGFEPKQLSDQQVEQLEQLKTDDKPIYFDGTNFTTSVLSNSQDINYNPN